MNRNKQASSSVNGNANANANSNALQPLARKSRIRRFSVFAAALAACLCSPGSAPQQASAAANGNGILICIDPGHQRYGNNELEPVGPGAVERKAKVSSGTTGVATKKPEYVLNLEMSLLLKNILRQRGYDVLMTRETHDVDISNSERAEMCNRARADLVVRIHADGDASARTKGFSVLYPGVDNPYTKDIYEQSKAAAEAMHAALQEGTGAKSKGIIPRNDLTGFNWSTVPNIVVEMGFMTNPEEDKQLSDPDYQHKLAESMADGVDRHFASRLAVLNIEPYDGELTLLDDAALYERQGSRFIPAGTTLSPQSVKAVEKAGGWYRVATWLGPLWIRGEHTLAGAVTAQTEEVQLTDDTPFYRYPSSDESEWGKLTPQTVTSFEAWNGWRHIRTWLGDAWIHA